jgi:hypothetical protein
MASDLLRCPSCQRLLRVPNDLAGRPLRCPTCDATFDAAEGLPADTPPAPVVAEPVPQRVIPPPAGRDDPRPVRRDLPPHRGVLILVLGILSLVSCGLLGPVAWAMGHADLAAIREGRMDPEGRGQTEAGRILGIIAFAQLALGFLGCCGNGALVGGLGAAGF